MTVAEVARRLGMSRTMVLCIQGRALAKLRAELGEPDARPPAWVERLYKATCPRRRAEA